MGIFDGIFGKEKEPVKQFSEEPADDETAVSSDTKKRLSALMVEMNKRMLTSTQLKLNPVRRTSSVNSSKLGGTPYFPRTMEYPRVKTGECAGEPLFFLAQLNFAELPHIEGFPEKGILQFFAGSESDDVVGVDFDDGTNQNGFRVFYHSEPFLEEGQLLSASEIPVPSEEHYGFPFKGEFALEVGQPEQVSLSSSDYRFERILVDSYNAVFGTNFDNVWYYRQNGICKADEGLIEELYKVCESDSAEGTKLGGFPYFTQDDPRGGYQDRGDFSVLLFQLDSSGDGEDEIIWGDCGVANFFISEKDLAALDFTKVLYNWDCC